MGGFRYAKSKNICVSYNFSPFSSNWNSMIIIDPYNFIVPIFVAVITTLLTTLTMWLFDPGYPLFNTWGQLFWFCCLCRGISRLYNIILFITVRLFFALFEEEFMYTLLFLRINLAMSVSYCWKIISGEHGALILRLLLMRAITNWSALSLLTQDSLFLLEMLVLKPCRLFSSFIY